MNNQLLILMIDEYKRLLELDQKRKDWLEDNPEKKSWDYKGQIVSRARLNRIGVTIRQLMIDIEKESIY